MSPAKNAEEATWPAAAQHPLEFCIQVKNRDEIQFMLKNSLTTDKVTGLSVRVGNAEESALYQRMLKRICRRYNYRSVPFSQMDLLLLLV